MDNAPILVSGPGRSGTTFMQWFLSSHPNIQIFGQPYIPVAYWTDVIAKIDAANTEVEKVNTAHPVFSAYPHPHHAGGTTGTFEKALAELVASHYTGYGATGKPRWGLKAVWSCADPGDRIAVRRLFPKAKWITCIRDPFDTLESIRSTFVRDYPIEKFFEKWAMAVEFATATKTPLVHIDHLYKSSPETRKKKLDAVLEYLGEKPTADTDDFIREWPIVHRNVGERAPWKISDDGIRQQLDENYRLVCAMYTAGYLSRD